MSDESIRDDYTSYLRGVQIYIMERKDLERSPESLQTLLVRRTTLKLRTVR